MIDKLPDKPKGEKIPTHEYVTSIFAAIGVWLVIGAVVATFMDDYGRATASLWGALCCVIFGYIFWQWKFTIVFRVEAVEKR